MAKKWTTIEIRQFKMNYSFSEIYINFSSPDCKEMNTFYYHLIIKVNEEQFK
jgi:hypothetical protein